MTSLGVTSLGDVVSDDDVSEGELRGAVRVRYTTSGCCVSPVRVATSSDGVKLGRDARPPTDQLRRLLCCRKRDEVLLIC